MQFLYGIGNSISFLAEKADLVSPPIICRHFITLLTGCTTWGWGYVFASHPFHPLYEIFRLGLWCFQGIRYFGWRRRVVWYISISALEEPALIPVDKVSRSPWVFYSSSLNVETTGYSETLVLTWKSIRNLIPEHLIFKIRHILPNKHHEHWIAFIGETTVLSNC